MAETRLFSLAVELTPLSYNSQYITKFGRGGKKKWTYLNPEFVAYKKEIQDQIIKHLITQALDLPKLEPNEFLHVRLEYYVQAFFLNGKVKTADNSNFIKPIEDAIKDAIGVDDSYNFELTSIKLDMKRHGLSKPVIFIALSKLPYGLVVEKSEYLKTL